MRLRSACPPSAKVDLMIPAIVFLNRSEKTGG